MQTFFGTLFQPFAIIKNPVRYYFLLLIMSFGILHLINELFKALSYKDFMESGRLNLFALIVSVLVFISQYFKQKKIKQAEV